jgi:hypothetical protein
MFKEITTFTQNKGISLIDSGSAEKGFTKIEILELLDLLSEQKIELLGLEVWYQENDSRIKIDSLASWIPSTPTAITYVFLEARQVIALASKNKEPIFTVQF